MTSDTPLPPTKEIKETPLKTVELAGQVVLKIMQHCNDALPQLVPGLLLGLDVGQTLEVTDCFPFPSGGDEDREEDSAAANYQLDMMRCLREVNVDNNTVGWYQSAPLGSYQTVELIETFKNYYESIGRKCVCLVYNPQKAQRGHLGLKAIRLKDSFVDVYKEQKLTAEKLREANVSWKDVFQEIPIKVQNSTLTQALVAEVMPDTPAGHGDFDRLNLSMAPFLEKNLESVIDCMDDLINEQQKVSIYHRNIARQEQQKAAWLQKRRAENVQRRAAGEELLPEEDPVQFKPIPEPTQLDTYLIFNQIGNFCDQVNAVAVNSLEKLYVAEALQKTL